MNESGFKPVSFEEIEEKTTEVLERFNITDCPADHMMEIIESENIRFEETDEFSEDSPGFYMVKGNRKVIVVKKTVTPPERKNFTIAHELGHYFLKHTFSNKYKGCRISEKTGFRKFSTKKEMKIEQEANVFAADFLLPKEMITPYIKTGLKLTDRYKYGAFFIDSQPCNYRDWNIFSSLLVHRFKTSKEAIKWRLYDTGAVRLPEKEGFTVV